jgi:hypothetical protein
VNYPKIGANQCNNFSKTLLKKGQVNKRNGPHQFNPGTRNQYIKWLTCFCLFLMLGTFDGLRVGPLEGCTEGISVRDRSEKLASQIHEHRNGQTLKRYQKNFFHYHPPATCGNITEMVMATRIDALASQKKDWHAHN